MLRTMVCSAAFAVLLGAAVTMASAPDGAIFTTLPDGSKVNYNIYDAKPDVYLDGGPGDKAPQWAAGLPDGVYVYQITDPSGRTLLSVDNAGCRQFNVSGGFITNVLTTDPLYGGCQHQTGVDADHGAEGALTVQMCGGGTGGNERTPTACFLDTPNPGGEYKAWVTPVQDYLDGCRLIDQTIVAPLDVVDCGVKTRGGAVMHGFIPGHSKTDNFKVGGFAREIDTRFYVGGQIQDGMQITWTDPLGASNNKWSYLDVLHDVNHEAHVEDVENGTHQIYVGNQPGCMVGSVYVAGKKQPKAGPQTLSISVTSKFTAGTIFVDVNCK